MDEPIKQTYYVRVIPRDFHGTYTDIDYVSRDIVLRIFRERPLDKYIWQLWDNVKEDWISPSQFVEDNL